MYPLLTTSTSTQELLDPLRAYCAHLLAKVTPGNLRYSFFCNSGTEAVEACLKMVHVERRSPACLPQCPLPNAVRSSSLQAILTTGRHRFVAAIGGFHGKTLGALACTSKETFRGPFIGALMNVVHLPINDIGALEAFFQGASFTGELPAALILEPIIGEGGIYICTDEYLRAARRVCDEYDVLLIFDEVQSVRRCSLSRSS